MIHNWIATYEGSLSRNKLANQLLVQSFDAKNANQFLEAEQCLKSMLAIEPNNLKAKRVLVEISTYLNKTEQINEIVLSVKQNENQNAALDDVRK
jgi:thioredoxin-like negative regulator of GroEL